MQCDDNQKIVTPQVGVSIYFFKITLAEDRWNPAMSLITKEYIETSKDSTRYLVDSLYKRTKYHQAACQDVRDHDSREPENIGSDSGLDERM